MLDERKSIWSWALYDWANSAFTTTVMAGFFPVFYEQFWSTTENVNESTFYLGLGNSAASILIAILAPFLGAIADKGTAKKKFLIFFAIIGIVMTGGLWIVQQGHWQMALVFYALATAGFMAGNIFYDALLVGVASRKKLDYVSSLGFALGYIGGGLLFLVNVIMYQKPELFGIPDGATAIRLSFLMVAIWWAVFSIPIMVFVKEPASNNPMKLSTAVVQGWGQLKDTILQIRELKVIGTFLLAYWLYIDGVDTIIKMAVKYGTSIGFPASTLITSLLLVQFVAFPAALAYNWFASKVGIKRSVVIAIFGYIGITIFGYFMQETWHFYVLAILVALFQGGIQALSRSMYARLIPKDKAAEFFGIYNMLGKFAAIIGPPLVGTVSLLANDPRIGILSILLLFIPGAWLLNKVNLVEGEQRAMNISAPD
jgi:UMF1 family MFS transporter